MVDDRPRAALRRREQSPDVAYVGEPNGVAMKRPGVSSRWWRSPAGERVTVNRVIDDGSQIEGRLIEPRQ